MTRWRALTAATQIEVATVFQVVAEMHIVGRPTQMMMGDTFTVTQDQIRADGVLVTVRPGHVVVRMADNRTVHLRPRGALDASSGLPSPRGKPSSDWIVERVS